MISYVTHGYIAQQLSEAAENDTHPEHSEAYAYLVSFRKMESHFFDKVHPQIDVGLAISETKLAGEAPQDIYTIHGPKHVYDLIRNMDKIAQSIASVDNSYALTPLEAYILLCAAHVHDAANVAERKDHPARCNQILRDNISLMATTAAIRQTYDVARVHGSIDELYGKDTIRSLDANNSETPRLPLLASILRLSDELSENPERVPEYVIQSHEYSEASKLAFAYANSLDNFQLRGSTLYIVYNVYPINQNLVVDENPTGCLNFMDFLEKKINVIENECRYCSQYGRPMLDISTISVTIQTFTGELPSPTKTKVSFNLHLNHGYPETKRTISERSPELSAKNIKHISECFFDANAYTQ